VTAVAFGTKLAWTWYTVVGTTATFGIGWVASLLSDEGRLNGEPEVDRVEPLETDA